MERGDGADGDAIDRFSRTWLKIFCFNGDVIEFDRRAKSRAFGLPDEVNQIVRGNNCCTRLCGDLQRIADFVGMPPSEPG